MMTVVLLEIVLLLGALSVFLLDISWKEDVAYKPRCIGWLATLFLTIGFIASFFSIDLNIQMFGGIYSKTPIVIWFQRLVVLAGIFCCLLSIDYIAEKVKSLVHFKSGAEYYFLLTLSLLGMCALAAANELVTIYIALELSTMPLYVLSCYIPHSEHSSETGMKFFINGVFSSGILLFGLSLYFGSIGGNTFLPEIATSGVEWTALNSIGALFIVAGIGFKITAAPFHLWSPDVYQGSPTPITAYLSVASKTAGLIVLYKFFNQLFVPFSSVLVTVVILLAIVTMTWGNLVAIKQTQMKRFLAYSSISQAGYILLAFVSTTTLASTALIYYLLVYLVSNIAVFLVVVAIENFDGTLKIERYKGLAKTSPVLALIFMLSLFSLAGIPPLPGFFGKFYLFSVAAEQGLYFLVLIATLNSVVSLYYYLKVVKSMYIYESELEEVKERDISLTPAISIGLVLAILGMILVVVAPGIFDAVQKVSLIDL